MLCHGLSILRWSLLITILGLFCPASRGWAESRFFKHDSLQLTLYGGNFDAQLEAQFVGIRNEYGLGMMLGIDLVPVAYLGLNLELLAANRDFDTPIAPPFFGTLDNDTSVQTTALLVGVRLFYPPTRAMRLYGVAGLGYYHTEMVVSGSLFGFPGVYRDDDQSLDTYYGAGLSYAFDNWVWSVNYRHINLSGDFDSFQIYDADLGGDLYALGVGYRF